MSKPIVSVIMPVYRAEKYVEKAVQSILNQTYEEFELIVVDDCGGDRSIEFIEDIGDPRILIIHNEKNRGIAYSRNRALKASTGKYIAIMDDDDISFPERLQKQVEFLEKNPAIDIIGGKVEWIDGNDEMIRTPIEVSTDREWIRAYYLFYNIFNNSEVMVRKDFLTKQSIYYKDNMLGMEDFDFWMRCSKVANITNLEDVLLKKRVIETNETTRVKESAFEARAEKYKEIQRDSLKLSGFELSTEELDVILGLMKEDAINVCKNMKEVQDIYIVLKKMVEQAKEKNMSFSGVINSWFHMLFIEIIKNMEDDDIWK